MVKGAIFVDQLAILRGHIIILKIQRAKLFVKKRYNIQFILEYLLGFQEIQKHLYFMFVNNYN